VFGGFWLKNKKITIVVLALLSAMLASQLGALSVGAAVTGVPGVAAGDWATYDFTFEFTTNDPNPPETPPDPETTSLEYYNMTVLSVLGSNVTSQLNAGFENGTQLSYVVWSDVATGLPNGPPYLIAANLSVGDSPPEINATVLQTYAGSEREVNILDMVWQSTTLYPGYKSHPGYSYTRRICSVWDRASGMLDEVVDENNYTKVSEGYETRSLMRLVIKQTNIWSPTCIQAEIAACPTQLNLRSRGRWITVLIGLPEGYNVQKVDPSSITLNGTLHPEKTVTMLDIDGDAKRELMVKFDRQAVIDFMMRSSLHNHGLATATLTVTGRLKDGTVFQGSCSITSMFEMPRNRALTEWLN